MVCDNNWVGLVKCCMSMLHIPVLSGMGDFESMMTPSPSSGSIPMMASVPPTEHLPVWGLNELMVQVGSSRHAKEHVISDLNLKLKLNSDFLSDHTFFKIYFDTYNQGCDIFFSLIISTFQEAISLLFLSRYIPALINYPLPLSISTSVPVSSSSLTLLVLIVPTRSSLNTGTVVTCPKNANRRIVTGQS